jgi:hypothetical protein
LLFIYASEAFRAFVLPNVQRVLPERTSFSLLLDTARSRGWIQMDAHEFMKIVCYGSNGVGAMRAS